MHDSIRKSLKYLLVVLGMAAVFLWLLLKVVALPVSAASVEIVDGGPSIYLPMVMSTSELRVPICNLGVGLWPYTQVITQAQSTADVGACWARTYLYWDLVEPQKLQPRVYDWSSTDAAITPLLAVGVQPIVALAANPEWAAEYPGGPVHNEQDILDFMKAAAERYDADGYLDAPGSPYVQIWEIYNEPDNQALDHAVRRGWGYWGGHGAEYVQFLGRLRFALRSVNPQAEVAMGGIAHERVADIFDMNFPQEIFAYVRDNPGEYFDYFNIHYFPVYEAAHVSLGPDIIGKTNYFREMMAAYGVSWPVIVTESGYWSGSEQPEPWVGSYAEQAEYVMKLYARSIALDLKAVMWLLQYDLPVHDADRGLNDIAGVPKPAYNAYWTFAHKLKNFYFVRSLSADELGVASAEGYAFNEMMTMRRLYLVWSGDETLSGTLQLNAATVLVSDLLSSGTAMSPTLTYFEPYTLTDTDLDGVIPVAFDSRPIYVEVVSRTLVGSRAR